MSIAVFTSAEIDALEIMGGITSTEMGEARRKIGRFMTISDRIREERQVAIMNDVAAARSLLEQLLEKQSRQETP